MIGWFGVRSAAAVALAILAAACGPPRDEAAPENESTPQAASSERVVEVTGGGPVIQVLPGPAQFADSARRIIDAMPAEARQMMTMMAQNGPFSDRVAEIGGTFSMTFWDRGVSGDSVNGVAQFTSQDGANWRVVLDRVAPEDTSPMEPHFGGVATDITYHGSTGLHVPLVPTVRSAASYWGMAQVYRNGQLVSRDAPAHVMMTSATRGSDFAYQCWNCTGNPILQLHLMLPPTGTPYDVPGGVIHVMWEKSQYRRSPTS
jgi:hypothetical protein